MVTAMMMEHFIGLVVLSVVALMVQGRVWSVDKSVPSSATAFRSFQRNYLSVFLIVMASDWLQGPYVYALYASYGFNRADIGYLFVAGFGASALFGAFVGSIADVCGRRRSCLLFALAYAGCSITKHFNSFPILLVGRLLGGIATSLLFSCFDAWMVHEHHQRRFNEAWLSQTFARATFANGLVAIGAGLVAALLDARFGPVAPFDASALCLIVAFVVIAFTWSENYGMKEKSLSSSHENNNFFDSRDASFEVSVTKASNTIDSELTSYPTPRSSSTSNSLEGAAEKASASDTEGKNIDWVEQPQSSAGTSKTSSPTFSESPTDMLGTRRTGGGMLDVWLEVKNAFLAIIRSPVIALCGGIQSSFESGMYIFVFMWTPSLPSDVNHGLIFAMFMVAIMIGSGVFSEVRSHQVSHPAILAVNSVVSAAALSLPIVFSDARIRLAAFIVFEGSCGVYFSSFYTLRSETVPDWGRATINNIYRIPLNAVVLTVCSASGKLSTEVVFTLCSILMALCALQCVILFRLTSFASCSWDAPKYAAVRQSPQHSIEFATLKPGSIPTTEDTVPSDHKASDGSRSLSPTLQSRSLSPTLQQSVRQSTLRVEGSPNGSGVLLRR